MGMRMPAARSAPCTSMPMMVPTRNRRFFSTSTRSIGRGRRVWRMKNHTTPTMPSAVVSNGTSVNPAEPRAEKP